MEGQEKKSNYPTQEDKARVQSTQAKQHGGATRGFASRIQSSADKHADKEGKEPNYPTQEDKSRVQSTQAKQHGGKTHDFASRIQSSADKHNPPN